MRIKSIGGKNVIIIEVPSADRHLRPIFLNEDILISIYRGRIRAIIAVLTKKQDQCFVTQRQLAKITELMRAFSKSALGGLAG